MDYNDENVKKAVEVLQSFLAVTKTTTKFTQQNAESLGLSLLQLGIVNHLNSTPGLTLKELTQKLQSSKSTVSINVDGLVEIGYVKRQPSSDDRREVNLFLTVEGIEVSNKSIKNAYSYRAMILALEKMEDKDVNQLLNLHNQLLSHLEKVEL
ncbi:MarR family winged helix-turn-helix transcriptional regulator [Neobacillus massiliamazoniensis]|uniref:MarR family transcriptional regulator n=1 Tax=Neobacillus massiliamazoniensis TaxID=1499688 RepID=A0A0U1NVM7_9BACI|nr:MarR family transcriptional regulator [Neobacillus massiliamazoniensis]CRK82035.1 MarR family transcriptional regulator [Neobacillus massiliamazoniensis]